MSRRLLVLLVASTALLVPPIAGAQKADEEQTFYESIDVQVVNLEVFVTDKSGKRITGLTKDDFQILEDGKPIEITNFFAVGHETPAAEPSPSDTTAAPSQPTALPDEQKLLLAVVVDNLSLLGPARNRLLQSVREKVVAHLQPEDLALAATFDGGDVEVVQGLTNDKEALLSALGQIGKGAPRGVERAMDRRRLLQEIDHGDALGGPRPEIAEINASEVYSGIELYVQQRFLETRATLKALTQFVDTLAGLPGRKALLYIGGGLSVRPGESFYLAWQNKFASLNPAVGASPFDGFRNDLTSSFDEMVHHANGNRVTFYTLGATEELAGVSADLGPSSTWTRDLENTEQMNLAESMRRLADGTGGLLSMNASDPGPILERMREDFDSYYSLGFVPQGKKDGKNRKIQVAVRGRRDLLVRHRNGRRERPVGERMTDRTLAALLLDPVQNPLDVALDFMSEKKNAKGQIELEVLVKFPLAHLVLLPQAKVHQGKVTVWVGARDQHRRNSPVQEIAIPICVANDQLLTALGQTAAYKMPLVLRPEEHRIAVVVRDELGNLDSTVVTSFKPGQTAAP
jgi:VWFA-related protein